MKKFIVPLIVAFILQIFISNLISIRGIRPDFLIIFLVYFALEQGSYRGVIAGFLIGILISLFDNSPLFGVLPLAYSIIGYGIGFLKYQTKRMIPYQFFIACILIILLGFFAYSYFTYDSLFYNDLPIFLLNFLQSTVYTLSLLIIIQFIIPLRK